MLGLVVVGAAAAAEAAAAVTAPVAAAEAEEGLAPGYWVEDEKGKCLDGSPPGELGLVGWGVCGSIVG